MRSLLNGSLAKGSGTAVAPRRREQLRDPARGERDGLLQTSAAPIHHKAGARIEDGKRRLFFDAFDRLVRVDRASDGQPLGYYTYDAAGRRVTKDTSTEHTAYVCDGGQEIEEYDLASKQLVADYVFGSLYVDEPVQMRRGGGTYYLHANASFSVAAITDASGQVVERYDYATIYGVHTASGTNVGNPWRFQGRRWEAETGLYQFRARYLDPEEGRFVNRDPRGVWGDAANAGNGYAFCSGDPVNGLDPTGLWAGMGTLCRAAYAVADAFTAAAQAVVDAYLDIRSGEMTNKINNALTPPAGASPNEDPTSAPITTALAQAGANRKAAETGFAVGKAAVEIG